MDRLADHLRSFGMSGFLVTEELRDIQRRLGFDLGHVAPPAEPSESTAYYPQFEQSVRTEAAEMARHYELFYCLEKAIRKLISETLLESAGVNWWESGRIPAKIVQDVKDRVEREVDSGVTRRSDLAIDYTTFGELSIIITNNWDLFGAILSSRRAVERVMSNLNTLRGPIAHCCPISDDEITRLQLAVKDWFRTMG